MNAYKTPHMRSRSQRTQRGLDVRTTDGKSISAHTVKGANGEWMISVYLGTQWCDLGYAVRQGRGWALTTVDGEHYTDRTLSGVIGMSVVVGA